MNCTTTDADTLKIRVICVIRIIRDSDNGGAQKPRPDDKQKKVGLARFPSYKKE